MLTGNSLLKFNVLLEVGNLQIQKFGSGRICTGSTKSTGYPTGSGAPLDTGTPPAIPGAGEVTQHYWLLVELINSLHQRRSNINIVRILQFPAVILTCSLPVNVLQSATTIIILQIGISVVRCGRTIPCTRAIIKHIVQAFDTAEHLLCCRSHSTGPISSFCPLGYVVMLLRLAILIPLQLSNHMFQARRRLANCRHICNRIRIWWYSITILCQCHPTSASGAGGVLNRCYTSQLLAVETRTGRKAPVSGTRLLRVYTS